jgi:3-oxoacyl-[acyl-carrier-protein] synthase II
MRRVVVTGMGVLSPIGNDLETFWYNALTGVSGVGPITRFDASRFKTQFACEVKNFNPENRLHKKELKKYDDFTIYALEVAAQAIEHAKIDLESINKRRVGIVWGSGNGGFQTFQNQIIEFALGDGTPRFNPYFIPKVLVDIVSGVLSIQYGFLGPNYSTISACASANHAISDAFNLIRLGKSDIVLTGGSEAAICEAGIGGFNALKALSTQNEHFQTASRPFDKNRDGFVMGEGAAALILEELEHAQKRGATIIAEVLGTGMAADAYHLTGTHPEGIGAIIGMQEALREANLQPKQIDYINAHATSTPLGDNSELFAMNEVFGKRKELVVSATKSMTGHLLGAAGAIEAVLSVLACERDQIPPTINTQNLEDAYADHYDFVLEKGKNQTVQYAISNNFGFGGHVASVIFGKFNAH